MYPLLIIICCALSISYLHICPSIRAFCGTRGKYLDSPLETFYWQNIKSAREKKRIPQHWCCSFFTETCQCEFCAAFREHEKVSINQLTLKEANEAKKYEKIMNALYAC